MGKSKTSGVLQHIPTGHDAFDFVIGGGIVPGSVILFGGEIGAGKSTLLLQVADFVAKRVRVLYVSSEQQEKQILQMAHRIGIKNENIEVLATRDAHQILKHVEKTKPALVIIDSLDSLWAFSKRRASFVADVVDLCRKNQTSAIVVAHLKRNLEFKDQDARFRVDTELMLYRYDSEDDGRPGPVFDTSFDQLVEDRKRVLDKAGGDDLAALASRRRRQPSRKRSHVLDGVDDLLQVRTLVVGKNRNGEENRKAFLIMRSDGMLTIL